MIIFIFVPSFTFVLIDVVRKMFRKDFLMTKKKKSGSNASRRKMNACIRSILRSSPRSKRKGARADVGQI